MKLLQVPRLLAVVASATLAACQIVGPDHADGLRTLPGAFALTTVSLHDALHAQSIPDSVNVRVYVTGITECPPGALCILPDGITVAEFLVGPAQEFAYLAVDKPRQFRIEKRYLMSVTTGSSPADGGTMTRALRLIGYDHIR